MGQKITNATQYSFRKGYGKVPQNLSLEVRMKIQTVLRITSTPQWNRRLNGEVIPNLEEAKNIETVFAEYGITEIWGAE
ncbi:MAG: hypothetical protein LBP67_05210 [Bacteroidales bacterium]|jgi:hypothetical protein|nr:hypothetical protein [Bacteroidales bacterium]